MQLTNKDISSIILSALCFTATAQMFHARYMFTGESGAGVTCGSKNANTKKGSGGENANTKKGS